MHKLFSEKGAYRLQYKLWNSNRQHPQFANPTRLWSKRKAENKYSWDKVWRASMSVKERVCLPVSQNTPLWMEENCLVLFLTKNYQSPKGGGIHVAYHCTPSHAWYSFRLLVLTMITIANPYWILNISGFILSALHMLTNLIFRDFIWKSYLYDPYFTMRTQSQVNKYFFCSWCKLSHWLNF